MPWMNAGFYHHMARETDTEREEWFYTAEQRAVKKAVTENIVRFSFLCALQIINMSCIASSSYIQPFPAMFNFFQHLLICFSSIIIDKLSTHIILKHVLLSGDIELNPGPYDLVKCIQASFHQGHGKFGATRGIQCSCISLYGICFSAFKSVSR